MGRKYFDLEKIIPEVEKNTFSQGGDLLIDYDSCDFSHRLVQPPIVCYLVTTVDENGNTNCAPISMGNAVWGGPPDAGWYFAVGILNSRQTKINMQKTKECVISYYPYSLMKNAHITGLPVPQGISEIDVADLTPVESMKVKPCGIAECPNNIECKVVHEYPAGGGTTIFILKMLAVNVSEEIYELDKAHPYQPGMVLADLMYEVSLNGKPERINYMRMNLDTVYREDESGDDTYWTGTFRSWTESERKRGKITDEEAGELIKYYELWKENPNPVENAEVKEKLTALTKMMAWR